MKLRIIVCLLTTFYSVSAFAEAKPCKVDPPIDTTAKAWCAIDKYLFVQSCLSVEGFSRDAKDLGNRWLLTIKDINPRGNKSCRSIIVEVCKKDGEIVYEPGSHKCST